jgi:hypothetical protein
MFAEKIRQSGNQPMCCDCRENSNVEHVRAFSNGHQAQGRRFQSLQQPPDLKQVSSSGVGQDNSLTNALEQRRAKAIFQYPDLSAYSALSQVQFIGSAGEAFVSRSTFESDESLDGRQGNGLVLGHYEIIYTPGVRARSASRRRERPMPLPPPVFPDKRCVRHEPTPSSAGFT